MPGSNRPAGATVDAPTVERWLDQLRLTTAARVERDGIVAWDLALDGRRRRDLRVTLILDPAIGAIIWGHLAPPIGDGLRKAYRTLLRWNEDFPLAKLSIAEDGRPILAVELPGRWLDRDELGLGLARVIGIADRVFEETREWLWIGGRVPDGYAEQPIRNERFIEEFASQLPELFQEPPPDEAGGQATGLPARKAAER
jgi:hypothetical protein